MVRSEFVILDTETTGLRSSESEIIEISAIRIKDGKVAKRAFSKLVKPEAGYIPPEIEALTGISTEMVQDAHGIDEAMKDFMDFIGDSPLTGWNVNFDMRFLNKYSNIKISNEIFDSMELVKEKLPNEKSYKLTKIAEKYNINTKGAHRSLNDCILTYKVLCFTGVLRLR